MNDAVWQHRGRLRRSSLWALQLRLLNDSRGVVWRLDLKHHDVTGVLFLFLFVLNVSIYDNCLEDFIRVTHPLYTELRLTMTG